MHRFAIQLFTVVLAVLVFWVLGFFVEDIQSIRGPDYASIENLNKNLVEKQADLEKQIADLTRQIENQTEKQRVVGDPSEYFKYIRIGGLMLVVARLLIHFIRAIAFPKTLWRVKQYREAYERFLCPVCEYPIRIGPRRFL